MTKVLTSQNGDTCEVFESDGVPFKLVKRADPERPNEVWNTNGQLHPHLWFYAFVDKKHPDEHAKQLGVATILHKYKEWAKEWEITNK